MSRKKFQLFAMLMILFTGFVLPLTFMPVKAVGTFDGTYDYSYNFHDPTGWHTRNIPSGFIVNNGKISSKGGHTGSVDASGNAQFTGPCPCGAPKAVFTGVLKSDGTGKGTYKCQYCLGGSWAVKRVSGGSGLPINIDFLYDIGPTGVVVVVLIGGVLVAIAHTALAKKKTPPPAKVSQPTRPKLKPIVQFPSSASQIKPTPIPRPFPPLELSPSQRRMIEAAKERERVPSPDVAPKIPEPTKPAKEPAKEEPEKEKPEFRCHCSHCGTTFPLPVPPNACPYCSSKEVFYRRID